VWSLCVLDGTTWRLVRSERSVASGKGDEASPEMFVPLESGETYALTLGAYAGMEIYSDAFASTARQGPIHPVGWLYGRAEGDDLSDPDDTYLIDQELDVIDLADPDGDGVTELCGDPCPDDPKDLCADTGVGDGKGTDGSGDDSGTTGTGTDGTGDGGTGDDTAATTDDTGSSGTDDGGGDDGTVGDDTGGGSSDGTLDDGGSSSVSSGGCACGSSSASPPWLVALLAATALRRRSGWARI
jgi:MYXO-CTERM domain-containing protein